MNLFLYLLVSLISLNSFAQTVTTKPDSKTPPLTKEAAKNTGFKKSFHTPERVVFERRNDSLFELQVGPFSFHEYDDQLDSSSEIGIGVYGFTDTGKYASGLNIIFGSAKVKNTAGTKLDGQYMSISQQLFKRLEICPSLHILGGVGLGLITGEVANVAPDHSYLRALTDQRISLMLRVLGNKDDNGNINPTTSGLYLNVGVKNAYIFNEPTVVDAGYGSNLGWFINISTISSDWLPAGSP